MPPAAVIIGLIGAAVMVAGLGMIASTQVVLKATARGIRPALRWDRTVLETHPRSRLGLTVARMGAVACAVGAGAHYFLGSSHPGITPPS